VIPLNWNPQVSEYVRQRAATMRAERVASGLPSDFDAFDILVEPTEPGKVPRIVRFHQSDGGGIECFDADTMECCPANSAAVHCSHVYRAVTLLMEEAIEAYNENMAGIGD
jgi:hypothetical protein